MIQHDDRGSIASSMRQLHSCRHHKPLVAPRYSWLKLKVRRVVVVYWFRYDCELVVALVEDAPHARCVHDRVLKIKNFLIEMALINAMFLTKYKFDIAST